MNIGIITHYQRETGNIGSVLQAFALNRYLRDSYPEHSTETILLEDDFRIGKVKTSYSIALLRKIGSKIKRKPKPVFFRYTEERQRKCLEFAQKNIVFSPLVTEEKQLENNKYDFLAVGSDVVWSQIRNNYNRVKFLAFKGSEKAVKFAYAASFGRNYIPFENRRYIRKALRRFKGIGVREKSAIQLLQSIGVDNAVHVADPTLLIDGNAWVKLSCMPTADDDFGRAPHWENKAYVLVFLLKETPWQKKRIERIKEETGKEIVFISNGYEETKCSNDPKLYDLSYTDISPEEWIWLIDHADYIVTDSFHCCAFSTMLKKKFIVLEREFLFDINVRILDYLDSVGCQDKFIRKDCPSDIRIKTLTWNYDDISARMKRLIDDSKSFIDDMMGKAD